MGILLSLQHDHIVPLLALCLDPLSLVLHLAPLGSLSDRLKECLRAGDRLQTTVIRDIIVQVGYYHCHCITHYYEGREKTFWAENGQSRRI